MPLFWMPFLWSNGGGVISQDLKKVIINKPQSLEALNFYANLRNKHHVAPTASEQGSATMAQFFMQQKIAMLISGRWNVPRFRRDIKFDWDIMPFPQGRVGSIVDADTSGWAISKDSKYKKEAWRLIKFLASESSISKLTESGLIVPSRIDVARSEIFIPKNQKPKSAEVFIQIIPDAIPTPVNDKHQEISDILKKQLEPLWNGKKTVNEVVTPELVKEIEGLL